jgi:hypothetical protein
MTHQITDTSFPPPGWVTNHQAAQMLGVSLQSLTSRRWVWRKMLRGHGKCGERHVNRIFIPAV